MKRMEGIGNFLAIAALSRARKTFYTCANNGKTKSLMGWFADCLPKSGSNSNHGF